MRVFGCGVGVLLLAVASISVSMAYAGTYEVGPGQTFSTIQGCLNVVIPGDTCNVHAGTYVEQLSLPASGTSVNRIMVKNNQNNAVTVQSSSSPVLDINAKSYWTFSGLNFTYIGSGSNPRAINHSYGAGSVDGITIKDCAVSIAGGTGSGFGIYIATANAVTVTGTTVAITATTGSHDGMEFLYTSNLLVQNNDIHGMASTSGRLEDGIVVNGTNIVIVDNLIHDGWSFDNHPDGIVVQGDGDRIKSGGGTTHNVTVARNTVYNFSQGIYFDAIFTAIDGSNVIANNLVYEEGVYSYGGISEAMNCILLHGENVSNNPGFPIVVKVYNNTLDCRQIQMFTDDLVNGSAIDIENNIFINSPFAGQQILFTNGVSMNYNYYSMGNVTPIRWGGSTYSLAAFKSTIGQEVHSATGTVGLNADYTENISSDSRNRGANFSAVFTNDRAGILRAASPASWDMGAYTNRSDFEPPLAPTNLRVQ